MKLSKRRVAGIIAGVVAIVTVGTAAYAAGDTPGETVIVGCAPHVVAVEYDDGTWAMCPTVEPSTDPTPSISPTADPTPSESPSPSASPSTTTTSPSPSPSSSTRTPPTSGARVIRAYTTWYSFYDNTPPGSAAISNPVLHRTAGGAGTYDDPITIAVGHDMSSGHDVLDWPAGTRFYIPNVRRYFIVEDTCGDGPTPQNGPCHDRTRERDAAGASTWLDGWAGKASQSCMERLTAVHTVIVDPVRGYPVVTGDLGGSGGTCAKQFGDTIPAVS